MPLPRVFRPATVLALCCVTLLAPGTALATEWSATPNVTLGMLENDNILLTPIPEKSVTALTFTPHLDLGAAEENWQVMGSAELRNYRYWGQSGLDTTDQVYDLSSLYKTERSTWQLNGGNDRESVISGTTFNPNIGIVHTQTQQTTRTLNPAWTWQASERTQLTLNYQSNIVSYENGLSVGLINYLSRDGTATLTYQWSPRDQFTVQIDSAYFKAPQSAVSQLGQTAYVTATPTANGIDLTLEPNPRQISSDSTTDSLLLGITHSFSETLTGNLAVGGRKTKADSTVETCTTSTPPTIIAGQSVDTATCIQTATTIQPENGSGLLYTAGFDKHFERTHLTLSVSRQVSPSGTGTQVQVTAGTLGVSQQVTENLNAIVSLAGYEVRALSSPTAQFTDRNYFQGGPSLSWNWTENLTVGAGYSYVRQKYLGTPVTAHENSVYLNFKYAWRKFSISR